MQRNRLYFTLALWILFPSLILSACSPAVPTNPPESTATKIVPVTAPTETATPEPTEAGSTEPQFQAQLAVQKFSAKVFKEGDSETEVQQDQQVDVQANDRIEVVKIEGEDEQSISTLNFPDFLTLELFTNAVLLLDDVKQESGGSVDVNLNLSRGHMFVRLNDQRITQVTVETPYSTIKTLEDGTEFDVCHNDALTCVWVRKGVAEVIGQGERETLREGEASYILKGEAPTSAICAPLETFLLWEENYRQSAATPALGQVVSELPPEPCAPEAADPLALPSNAHIVYQDEFKNPATGWPSVEIDNYLAGYSEREYYQIEIRSADDKYLVNVPGKKIFENVNVDLQALTAEAQSGDFQYGLVFRRSGNRYYAFTISPSTKKWYVLKSSSNALETLKEGTENGIQELGGTDVLRVTANGSTFFFYINGQLVGQASDSDYTSGEVGLFVQTIDSPAARIHFDSTTIWDTQAPEAPATSPATIPTQSPREQCFNEIDDDGDRLIDRLDPECQRDPSYP